MKSKAIPALFLSATLLLILLFVSPFFVTAESEPISGETTLLGEYKTQIEETINTFESRATGTPVLIRIHIDYLTYPDLQQLYNVTKAKYNQLKLISEGVPTYNILIYYGKYKEGSNTKTKLLYYNPLSCKPREELLAKIISGSITQGSEGEEILKIVQTLTGTNGIKKIKDEYGENCATETGAEKTDITIKKSVYIIDDTNWKNVLSLIPLSTWHDVSDVSSPEEMKLRKNKIIYNPFFVYHSEDEQMDLDSIIILLKQFSPEKVTIVHDKEMPEKIASVMEKEKWQYEYLSPADYAKKWKSDGYDAVVLSKDDYKTGLMASVFASYVHSPLVFSVSDLENYKNYKTLYCIDINIDGCTYFTLDKLQKYYAGDEVTGTDKAILVNPKDIENKNCESFEYTREFGKLTKAYCKDSLVSPILASVKNELIIFTDAEPLSQGIMKEGSQRDENKFEEEIAQKSSAVKSDIKKQTQMSDNNYLTVFASPRAIPLSVSSNLDYRKPLDPEYSEGKAVGRIFGITVTDTSIYVNRVIAFSKSDYSYVPDNGELDKFNNILLLADKESKNKGYIPEFNEQLKNNGYSTSCFAGDDVLKINGCQDVSYFKENKQNILENSNIIIYDDDASTSSWIFTDISSSYLKRISLSSPVVITAACSGLDYYSSTQDELLGPNFIRSGALGYYGAVSETALSPIGSELFSKLLGTKSPSPMLEGYGLGNALVSVMNDKNVLSYFEIEKPNEIEKPKPFNYILLGDPTVQLALPRKVDIAYTMSEKPDREVICGPESCGWCKGYKNQTDCEKNEKGLSAGAYSVSKGWCIWEGGKCMEKWCTGVTAFDEGGKRYITGLVSGSIPRCENDPCSLCDSGKAVYKSQAESTKKCECLPGKSTASGPIICDSKSNDIVIDRLILCGEPKTMSDFGSRSIHVNWRDNTMSNGLLPRWCYFPATLKLERLDKDCTEYRCKDESCTKTACDCYKTQKSPPERPKDPCLSYGDCATCVADTTNKCKWSLSESKCSNSCTQNCAITKSQCPQTTEPVEDVYICAYKTKPAIGDNHIGVVNNCQCKACTNPEKTVIDEKLLNIEKIKCSGTTFYPKLSSWLEKNVWLDRDNNQYLCIMQQCENNACVGSIKVDTDAVVNILWPK